MGLKFLHLSDIHFKKQIDGGVLDADADIRYQLALDFQRKVAELGQLDGILVTGDIAFSAQKDEYERASEWLAKLSGIGGMAAERVWTVPGNHDVDWTVIDSSELLQRLRTDLRQKDMREIDSELSALYQSDPQLRKLAYEPLHAYNAFAAPYRCEITADAPYWEDDFTLGHDTILRLRGLNSTLISYKNDDDRSNKLLLGQTPAALHNEPGVEYLTLCHHPPSWLLDADAVSDLLLRARIQLFGHKHRSRLQLVEQTLIVSAGATHPSRREPAWEPRYNIITIDVQDEGAMRNLDVTVHVRTWTDESGGRFVDGYASGGGGIRRELIPIQPVQPQEAKARPTARLESNMGVALSKRNDHPEKTLSFRFLDLDFISQLEIAKELGMDLQDIRSLSPTEFRDAVVRFAAHSKQSRAFWNLVEQVSAAKGTMGENPF